MIAQSEPEPEPEPELLQSELWLAHQQRDSCAQEVVRLRHLHEANLDPNPNPNCAQEVVRLRHLHEEPMPSRRKTLTLTLTVTLNLTLSLTLHKDAVTLAEEKQSDGRRALEVLHSELKATLDEALTLHPSLALTLTLTLTL